MGFGTSGVLNSATRAASTNDRDALNGGTTSDRGGTILGVAIEKF